MKAGWILGVLMLPYAGAFLPGSAGNPDRQPYMGEAGSVYDSAANPPRTDAVVAYDPNAPLPKPVGNGVQPNGAMLPASKTP